MRTFWVALGSIALASSAMAADLPVKAPALLRAAPVQTWTGFYVGGDMGGLWTHSGSGAWTPTQIFNFGEFPNVGTLDNSGGFVGGVHAGYNWQFAPTWVAGIEGDWSWTNAKASFNQPWVSTAIGLRPDARASVSLSEDWLATVRGRIGYLVTPAALVYFTGGAAWAKFDYDGNSHNEPTHTPFLAQSQFSETKPGYVLGGGLEYAFSPNWSARAEYLYYHFNTDAAVTVQDSTGNFVNPPNAVGPTTFSWTGGTTINVVRAGVSYKF
jgi:outer membrane immunogenic protein